MKDLKAIRMKSDVASKMLQKLQDIDLNDVQSITVTIAMNGGPTEETDDTEEKSEEKSENCPDCGNKEENCVCKDD